MKKIFLILLFIICSILLNLILSINPYAYAYDNRANCSPGAPCYCYPVYVEETQQACSSGTPSKVYVQWDGSNCVYCQYYAAWTDNSGSHNTLVDNGCSGYSTTHVTLNGSNIRGNISVHPNGSSNTTTVSVRNTCPTLTPTPTNTPTPTPTPTNTPTPTFTPTPTPTNTPTPTPTPITSAQNPYCDASGYIHNLNFGINNDNSWIQSVCGDVGIQSPSDNPLPQSGTTCGGVSNSYSNIIDSTCINPGIFFSGSSNPTFGGGGASSTGWIVPNYTGETGILPTSWQYLTDTAQINGIAVNELNTYETQTLNTTECGDYSNCMLNQAVTLPSGVYKISTNNNTSPLKIGRPSTQTKDNNIYLGTTASPKNYVFLVDGDMYIMGKILVPVGSTATFSVKGNIYVDKSVGETDTTSLNGDIQGFYSTDKNFIVQSYQGIPQTNEVKNPSFEPDTSSWYISGGATVTSNCSSATDGSCSADANVTTAGSQWQSQLQQSGIPVVAGTTYSVSFDAKGDSNTNGKPFTVWLQQTNNPYQIYGQSPSYSLTTSWKHYSFSFAPSTTDLSENIRFNFGSNVGHYYVDNVQVTTNTTVSRVQNSSFENNPLDPPWFFNTNVADGENGTLTQKCGSGFHTDGNCSAYIQTTSATTPSNYWEVNMGQGNIPIFNGTTYTVQFDAMAPNGARPVWVYLQQAVSPWKSYGSFHFPSIGTTWASYSFSFPAQDTDTNARLYFETGETTGDLYVDNVSVTSTAPIQLCNANDSSLDKRLNITGSIVVNAGGTGGAFTNQRDLCANDNCPSVTFEKGNGGTSGGNGLSYVLNAPAFLKRKTHKWQEIAPGIANTPTPTP